MTANEQGITVRLLYFAAIRDQAGIDEERLELPSGVITVDDLFRRLEQRTERPLRLEGVRAAINEEFADGSAKLSPEDVVALIPPVSGG